MYSNRLWQLEKVRMQQAYARDKAQQVDVCEHIAPVYLPLHEDIASRQHQYYNLPGGRGSGKSSFIALEVVSGVMHDATGNDNAIIFRRTANTMRESVFSQIAWAIDKLDVNEFWRGNVSPMCFTYLPTGAQIIFRGLDEASKLKSIKAKKGTFKYIWFEEYSELPGENFTRNVLQSVLRGGNNFVVFRSFNPPLSKNNWANKFIERPDTRAITLRTTYKDVPQEWLGDDFIYEAERLQEINPQAYEHEYMGIATGSGGEVFPNIEVREITSEEINELQYIYCGLDFGFSVDPACFIRCAYDNKYDRLFLLDEIYKKHLSNEQLAAEIKEREYNKAVPKVSYYSIMLAGDVTEKQLIIADAAEPKSIADLQGEGLKVTACKKYPGSVIYGIKWLQRRHIVIDPARTPNAYREFTQYEYMQTKDGEFLADVPDKNNHSIDAVRYALDRIINHKGISA